MKRIPFLPALLIGLSGLFSFAACTNDNSANPTPDVVQNIVQSGDWIITSFIDSGKDETSHFTGNTFSFDDNGVLVAKNGGTQYTGSWSITNSNSNDDSPGSDVDFNILFNLNNDFEDLSEDWHIVSQSDDKIELIHVSGGNGGTDFLTFERA